jgi:hypothetical protein
LLGQLEPGASARHIAIGAAFGDLDAFGGTPVTEIDEPHVALRTLPGLDWQQNRTKQRRRRGGYMSAVGRRKKRAGFTRYLPSRTVASVRFMTLVSGVGVSGLD